MIKILSMTGCGYARIQGEDSIITVEVKSVNSRYLDLNIKMPRMYQRVEVQQILLFQLPIVMYLLPVEL